MGFQRKSSVIFKIIPQSVSNEFPPLSTTAVRLPVKKGGLYGKEGDTVEKLKAKRFIYNEQDTEEAEEDVRANGT